MTNILFICKANRFRSKIAEAYFKKINKNKKIQVKSAGILPGWTMIHKPTKKLLKEEFGLTIKGKPQGINKRLMTWANIIIIVADNVPPKIFEEESTFRYKVINWKVHDADHKHTKEVRRAARQIIEHINKFVKTL
jgi:protein-tyrosine-phosphatase